MAVVSVLDGTGSRLTSCRCCQCTSCLQQGHAASKTAPGKFSSP